MKGYLRQRVIKYIFITFLCWSLGFSIPTSASENNSPLVFSVHPYLPQQILKQRFNPLVEYLSTALNKPIQLRISKNYETHIEHIANNVADIAYLGPAAFVELSNKYGEHPLLARLEVNGSPTFHGYIVTQKKSDIQSLQQLKGKRFAFGSPHSTMSYLVPRYMLSEANIHLDQLSDYKFLGNHRNVALSVLLNEFDAGAIKEEVFKEFEKKGLRILATSPAISEHVFVSSKNMHADLRRKLSHALQTLSDTQKGKDILTGIKKGVSRLVPASNNDYDNLRKIMH